MIKVLAHDGAKFKELEIKEKGFILDNNRDIKNIPIYDTTTGIKTDDTETVFNFVGFVSNNDDDLLVVFPKHYDVKNVELDSKIVFNCISKHLQRRPDLYIGNNENEMYKSNYPFASFFGIYDYFTTYGLYFEDKIFIKPNTNGKVSWKETISRCDKYVIGNNMILYPIFYKNKFYFANFITECMIFAIDYTISKFGILIDAHPTGEAFPEINIIVEREYRIKVLQNLKQQTFKDNELTLIDNLIVFFSNLNIGGNYYLKHYKFSSIWEDMVAKYLCYYYKGINSSNEIIFDKSSPKKLQFIKQAFHTNDAKPNQYITPDYYGEDGNIQLIFDAKYYSYIYGMNYKQIAYVYMLREIQNSLLTGKKYLKTFSALILPSETRSTKIHFQLNPLFGSSYNDVIMTEEYIDIKEVMQCYNEIQ